MPDEHQPDLTGNGATEPPEPDPSPPDPDDQHRPAPAPAPSLPGPAKLHQPDDTRETYVVLWAPKPPRGQRADYQEVCFIRASSPDRAKRLVIEEPHDHAAGAFLRNQAEQHKSGILLRAVPAMHWPADVTPTTYARPAPVLTVG